MTDAAIAVTTFDRLPLTAVARRALEDAGRLAASRGRAVPVAEEIAVALLLRGREESALRATLNALGYAEAEVATLLLEISKITFTTPVLSRIAYDRFLEGVAAHERTTIDCLALLGDLLGSSFCSPKTRGLLDTFGLDRQTLLQWPNGIPATLTPVPGEPVMARPPLGRRLVVADLTAPVARDRLTATVASRFARGESVALRGLDGIGKAHLARFAAAVSGRPAIEIRMSDLLGDLLNCDLAHAVGELAPWLVEHQAGLVLADLGEREAAALRLPASVPVIIGGTDATHPWTFAPQRRFWRYTLRPLAGAAAVAALRDWSREPGSPAIDPSDLAHVVDLTARFLPQGDVLPGTAVQFLRYVRNVHQGTDPLTRAQVDESAAYCANLPLALVSDDRLAKLRTLPERLGEHIIGQRAAIKMVSDGVLRREVAFGQRNRPMGVYIFIGPTGVGKTELARALAMVHFGSEDDLVKFDMGDFGEKHEAMKLVGAPPSYIGHDEPGQMIAAYGWDAQTKAQTRKGAVLLLDEFEKAHDSVQARFLAAFDKGIFTGSKGEKIDLRDSIVIMTSNIGVREASDAAAKHGLGFGSEMADRSSAASSARTIALNARFSPEFRNRVDGIVEFADLSAVEMSAVLEIRVRDYAAKLRDAGLNIEVGPRLRERMVGEALASGMGARELVRRRFDHEVEDRVTRALLDGMYARGVTFTIETSHAGETALVAARALSARFG